MEHHSKHGIGDGHRLMAFTQKAERVDRQLVPDPRRTSDLNYQRLRREMRSLRSGVEGAER